MMDPTLCMECSTIKSNRMANNELQTIWQFVIHQIWRVVLDVLNVMSSTLTIDYKSDVLYRSSD